MRIQGSNADYLRDQFHDKNAYLSQSANIFLGAIRFLAWSAFSTIVITGGLMIFILLTADLSGWSSDQLVSSFQVVVILASTISLLVCAHFNVGRFQFVFSDKAQKKQQMHGHVIAEANAQMQAIEHLLVDYKLIKPEDVENRHAKLKSENI